MSKSTSSAATPALAKPARKTVHMTLCGKGGVGKSVVARLLAEYLTSQGQPPLAFDADPLNTNFASVKAFGAEKVQLFDKAHRIHSKLFDAMVVRIFGSDRSVLIDTGAASYVPLFNYMRELKFTRDLDRRNFDLMLHVIIAGGPALPFTMSNLADICKTFGGQARITVWLNHYWEEIEHEGKPFTELPAFKANQAAINGLLEIERMAPDTSAEDFAEFLKQNISFDQALDEASSSFNVVEQSRLFNIRETIFEGMDAVLGTNEIAQPIQEALT